VTTVCQAHITNEPIKLKIIEEKKKEYGREIKEEAEQSLANYFLFDVHLISCLNKLCKLAV
jgi:hypothetical protein